MNFEWDDTKRKSNIKKHGIDFINAPMIFAGYTLTIEDDRYDYVITEKSVLLHLGFWMVGSSWLFTQKPKIQ